MSKQEQRQRLIAEHILKNGSVRIEELAARFEISLMTIHRDLDSLEARSLVRKSRGWATAVSSNLAEASDVFRLEQQGAAKRALAAALIERIDPGQTIFLDDSTTTAYLIPLLSQRVPMTIITNYLHLMNELGEVRDITLLGLGGEYMTWSRSFLGEMTVKTVRAMAADLVVMSASAIVGGTCYQHRLETVAVKRAMLDSAARRVLLADHTKFTRRALHALAEAAEFDEVLVDAETPDEVVDGLRQVGATVVRVTARE